MDKRIEQVVSNTTPTIYVNQSDAIYIVQEYIKEKTGQVISINLQKHTNGVLGPHLHLLLSRQINLLLTAFDVAYAHYRAIYINEKK